MWPLYAGGFLGPFGGAMVTPMLPELADGLHTTLTVAASSLTAYLIPFASIMVVSGTLAERWGRRRTVQVAYAAYAVASLVCAVAPTAPLFLTARAFQGAANAFITPVLVAAISDLVAPGRLGRALGWYASLQAAGQAFAPLIGGVAAAVQWRLAFIVTVAAALLLAVLPPAQAPRSHSAAPARWRSLLNAPLALACALAFLLYQVAMGMTVLVALVGDDRFGLTPDARGLVVAGFGAAGLAAGGQLGGVFDRVGARVLGLSAMLATAAAAALLSVTGNLVLLVLLVAIAGAANTAGRVTVNSMAVRSTPGNRSGATSMMLAWQFLGGALAPLILLPIYHHGAAQAFWVPAGAGALAALLYAGAVGRRRFAVATP